MVWWWLEEAGWWWVDPSSWQCGEADAVDSSSHGKGRTGLMEASTRTRCLSFCLLPAPAHKDNMETSRVAWVWMFCEGFIKCVLHSVAASFLGCIYRWIVSRLSHFNLIQFNSLCIAPNHNIHYLTEGQDFKNYTETNSSHNEQLWQLREKKLPQGSFKPT